MGSIALFLLMFAPQAELTLPAWSGYARPDAGSARRNRAEHVTAFTGQLAFYVHLAQPGPLDIEVHFEEATAVEEPPLRATFGHQYGADQVSVALQGRGRSLVSAGPVWVAEPGYHRLVFERTDPNAGELSRPLVGVTLRGAAVTGARATTVERRNAASVHLGYPAPMGEGGRERDDVECLELLHGDGLAPRVLRDAGEFTDRAPRDLQRVGQR